MNWACLLGSLIRTRTRFPLSLVNRFSSISASNAKLLKNLSTDEDEVDDEESGSSVYRRFLRVQRPTSIKWDPRLHNSVNLIGHVDQPLRKFRANGSGVYTFLQTTQSSGSYRPSFRIMLAMWDDMAKMCGEHLKPRDFVHVSGCLKSYMKDGLCNYKVIVYKLNYVAQPDQGPGCPSPKESSSKALQKNEESESESERGEIGMERDKTPLHLWQLFFRSPHEWWDNRKSKKSTRHPDFKHKITHEALWVSTHDPPWVKRQLQMLDSKIADQCKAGDLGSHSRVSKWIYDE